MPAENPTSLLLARLGRIAPMDDHEAADLHDIAGWVTSGEPLYRVRSPVTPPRHLVVYVALLDETARRLMLVDHIKAGCWLLPGGHVEPDEDPALTAVREAREELGIDVVLNDRLGGADGFFVTQTQTRGAGTHTDVTIWFVAQADHQMANTPDPGEFHATAWLPIDGPAAWDSSSYDPQMPPVHHQDPARHHGDPRPGPQPRRPRPLTSTPGEVPSPHGPYAGSRTPGPTTASGGS